MKTSFNPTTHTYTIAGKPVPSVTGILKEAGLIDTTWFTPESTARGLYVHKACELYDKDDLDFNELDPRLVGYVSAWSRFRKESGIVPTIIEKQYYSAEHGFAGTVDRCWKDGKHFCVADIKSGALPAWLPLQLAAYSILVNAFSGMGIELKANGNYSVKLIKTPELFRCRKIFLEVLELVKIRRLYDGKESQKCSGG